MADIVGPGRSGDILSGSPLALLSAFAGGEPAARGLAATLFWQAFLGSAAYRQILSQNSIANTHSIYVVRHGDRQDCHDLVILDSARRHRNELVLKPVATSRELAVGWDDYAHQLSIAGWDSREFLQRLKGTTPARVAASIGANDSFRVVVTRQPALIQTAARPQSITTVVDGPRVLSTVGVIASNRSGQIGATTALHAVAGRTTISINGHAANIVSHDRASDSCLLAFAGASLPSGRTEGPMSGGLMPRPYQNAHFEGATSGRVTTQVIAWSPSLPHVARGTPRQILTQPTTNPGDSGAALYETSPGGDTLLGFAFQRTGPNAIPAYSEWTWAECVFLDNDLI